MKNINKLAKVLGVLAGVSSLVGILSILFFNQTYNHVAIVVGIFAFVVLVKKDFIKNE